MLNLPGPLIEVPDRLVELIGAGPNGWTAQEGALKIREASYVAAEGLSAEQFFHGPSVALDEQDTIVVLDGGGPMADRTEAIAAAVEVTGAQVARFPQRELGEALSVFPLTVVVQRIALELSEARDVSPDRFRYEDDERRQAALRRSASNRHAARFRRTPRCSFRPEAVISGAAQLNARKGRAARVRAGGRRAAARRRGRSHGTPIRALRHDRFGRDTSVSTAPALSTAAARKRCFPLIGEFPPVRQSRVAR